MLLRRSTIGSLGLRFVLWNGGQNSRDVLFDQLGWGCVEFWYRSRMRGFSAIGELHRPDSFGG